MSALLKQIFSHSHLQSFGSHHRAILDHVNMTFLRWN